MVKDWGCDTWRSSRPGARGPWYCANGNCPFWTIVLMRLLSVRQKKHLPDHRQPARTHCPAMCLTQGHSVQKHLWGGPDMYHAQTTLCGGVMDIGGRHWEWWAVCVWVGGGKALSRGQFGGNVRLVGFTSVLPCARLCATTHTLLIKPFVRNREASRWHVSDTQQPHLSVCVCVHINSGSHTETLVAHLSSRACPMSSFHSHREALLIQAGSLLTAIQQDRKTQSVIVVRSDPADKLSIHVHTLHCWGSKLCPRVK